MEKRDKEIIANLWNGSVRLKKYVKEKDWDKFWRLLRRYGKESGNGTYYYCSKFYEAFWELNIDCGAGWGE